MGNAEVHLEKCEISDPERRKLCELLKIHKLKMGFIDYLGETLEKIIYISPHTINGIKIIDDHSGRTSLYQILGDCLKKAGLLMGGEKNSFTCMLTLIGRTEKMLGQIENRCVNNINALFLVPIQKIRCYNKEEILPISLKIGEITSDIERLKLKTANESISSLKIESEINDLQSKYKLNKTIIEGRISDCDSMIVALSFHLIALVDNQTESLKKCLTYFENLSTILHNNTELINKSTDFTTFSKRTHSPIDYRKRIYKHKLNESTT